MDFEGQNDLPSKKQIAASLQGAVSRVMSEMAKRRWKGSTTESRKLALKPAHDARRKRKPKPSKQGSK